jgi:hypothetical protein
VTTGRIFSPAEDAVGTPVALVDARTAGAFWKGTSAVNRWLSVDARDGSKHRLQVIGTLSDLGYGSRRRAAHLDVYVPYSYAVNNWPSQKAALVVHSRGQADTAVEGLRTSLGRTEPQVGLSVVRSLATEFAGDRTSARLTATLLASLGAVGLFLSVTGLYGLMSYLAAQRQREIGIRMALGASLAAICRLAAREGAPSLAKGAAIGGILAVLVALFLRTRAFPDVSPFDGASWAAVLLTVFAAGLFANTVPFIRYGRWQVWRLLRED